jgi:hypothetical protein
MKTANLIKEAQALLAQIEGKTASSAKLEEPLRKKVNQDLRRAGFDGNGRFSSVGQAINKMTAIIEKHGLELDEVTSAWNFNKDEGSRTLRLAKQTEDAFSPIPIKNSQVVFQWHTLENRKLEVIVYLS